MKIKSWTGNEVEARVGMETDAGTIVALHSINKTAEVSRDGKVSFIFLFHCTMLHCPFQAGDFIHCGFMHQEREGVIQWFEHYKYGDPSLHPLNKNEQSCDFIRHANRALRDAPEYNP